MKTKFDELLEFPCVQNFRVMGIACDNLADIIIAELQKSTPGDYAPKIKPSKNGNYLSITLAITFTSKEHIEQVYKDLSAIEEVRYVL